LKQNDNDDEFDVSPKAAAAVGGGCQGGIPRVGGWWSVPNPAAFGSGETVGTTDTILPSKYAKFDAANEDGDTYHFCGQYNDCDETIRGFDAAAHTDWGSYYDPQNIFFVASKYDCYKILGLDCESFGDQQAAPTPKGIWQRYVSVTRAGHTENPNHTDAQSRFLKIIRAYEIFLTDARQKMDYDDWRYNPEAFVRKYGGRSYKYLV
jgi:hypothetical protein